jgi:aspartyl-tRNA(Asn)/glutamyl-tRNA(Gln) amidotransferase subunit B
MYPDTDTPPIPITDALVADVESSLPELPWQREQRYRQLGLDERAARSLAAAPWAELFDALEPAQPETARRLAAALEKRLVHFWRQTGHSELPRPERLRPLVAAVDGGDIAPAALEACFDRLLAEPDRPAEELLAEHRPGPNADRVLRDALAAAAAARVHLDGKPDDAVLRWAVGRTLAGVKRGRLDPVAVRDGMIRELGLEVEE